MCLGGIFGLVQRGESLRVGGSADPGADLVVIDFAEGGCVGGDGKRVGGGGGAGGGLEGVEAAGLGFGGGVEGLDEGVAGVGV